MSVKVFQASSDPVLTFLEQNFVAEKYLANQTAQCEGRVSERQGGREMVESV